MVDMPEYDYVGRLSKLLRDGLYEINKPEENSYM